MRSNLANLLTQPEHQHLKQLLVENKEPQFPSDDEIAQAGADYDEIVKDLNRQQCKAVLQTVLCKDFQMVIGVPGSGKSLCITKILRIMKK
jgi:hypothetical protein